MDAVEAVRERADIVAIVGDYVALKKSGKTFQGLCPFHSERTASFVVFPDSGNWHCFGACATGGDVFSFIMRAENVDFRGALELLARRVGVDLAPPSPAAQAKEQSRERLRAAVAAAAELYHTRLTASPGGEPGRAYLASRGFGAEVTAAFGLGWAPEGWTVLADHLATAGFSREELLAAGLIRAREAGGVFDLFRGRLIFPIGNARGEPVGFGARTVDPAGTPKYLNSPQSDIFDKSRVLFGLDRAAKAIRESGQAVVVEGYTDVLRAHAAGYANVVASLGTALTEHQLVALKRYAKTIILALDADAAGQAATLRGLEVAREAAEGGVMPVPTARGWIRYEHRLDLELRVASLPAGQDPDDVIRDDPAAWGRLIDAARPVMEHLFDVLTADLDLADARGKTQAADRLMPIIATIPDPVARAAWVARLTGLIGIDERVLAARLADPTRGQAARSTGRRHGRPDDDLSAHPAGARSDLAGYLLGHLLLNENRRLLRELNAALEQDGQRPIGPDDFEHTEDGDLIQALRYAARGAPPPDAPPEHRLDALPDHLARHAERLRERARSDPPMSEHERIKALRTALLRLRERELRRSLAGLRALAAQTAPDDRPAHYQRVAAATTQLNMLQRLIAPEEARAAGKLDSAIKPAPPARR
jgi:DNA primase